MSIGVVGFPRRMVRLAPLFPGHCRVTGDVVIEIVLVQIGIHWDTGLMKLLVIFGTGQRRQVKELEQVDWQLALNDLDVVDDRFARVAGKAEDVTAVGDDAGIFPREQHLSIIGDLVLAFLCAEEALGIYILQTDEDALHPGTFTFFDKAGQLMTERVDLDDETDLQTLNLAKIDQLIEYRLPVFVTRKVVVRNEERVQSLVYVDANDAFDIFGRASPRLATLHIYDRAERACERTASAGVEARRRTGR